MIEFSLSKVKTSWDTFVNDFIMNSEYIHFHKVLDKLLETINHYNRKDILQSKTQRENNNNSSSVNSVLTRSCGKIMEKLKPIIAQAGTVLKEEEQYKITLNMETNEWIFQFPIHDVIKTEVAKAILLDPFIPITVCLKLQIKLDGINPEGELLVLRVETYQHRSGKMNTQIKDIAWDFIEKNWGRIGYWLKYGQGGTLMFSTSTNKTKKDGKRKKKSSRKKDGHAELKRSRSYNHGKSNPKTLENDKKSPKPVKRDKLPKKKVKKSNDKITKIDEKSKENILSLK